MGLLDKKKIKEKEYKKKCLFEKEVRQGKRKEKIAGAKCDWGEWTNQLFLLCSIYMIIILWVFLVSHEP